MANYIRNMQTINSLSLCPIIIWTLFLLERPKIICTCKPNKKSYAKSIHELFTILHKIYVVIFEFTHMYVTITQNYINYSILSLKIFIFYFLSLKIILTIPPYSVYIPNFVCKLTWMCTIQLYRLTSYTHVDQEK